MAQSKRKFYRTTITVTVLSEEPFDYDNLEGVHYAITEGECSGHYETTKSETLTAKQVAEALQAEGSDPEFFQLTDEGEDI